MLLGENKKNIIILTILALFLSVTSGFAGALMILNSLGAPDADLGEPSLEVQGNVQGQTMDQGASKLGKSAWGLNSSDELTIPEIYTLVSDSVVEITTETMQVGGFMGQYISSGAGSGVIYSENGYIITNNHVINNASKVIVRLKNGHKYEADIVAKDEKTDLAVIKIDENGLQSAFLADSDKITVGELAVAIGNPLGELGGTITEGIISALDREIIIDNETMVLLQTTAAINPGNSGGGLFNSRGELLGIVNAKTSGSNIEGLGFAIPSNLVSDVAKELIEFGYVKGRPALGVSIFEVLDARTAILYRLENTGLYIANAKEGSSFQIGDRIVSFEEEEVAELSKLKKLIDSKNVGDIVKVKVARDNNIKELKIELVELS